MSRVGIMQGRLLPAVGERTQAFPRDGWEREFVLAADAGLDDIEWIYDVDGAQVNPIATDEGVERVRALAERHGVEVRSLCADWFIDRPLVRAPEREGEESLARLNWLLGRGDRLGLERVVLPFVDNSTLAGPDDRRSALHCIERALPAAETAGIEIHLEADLDPPTFADFLDRIPTPLVKVNYDTGNSASVGYSPREEFAAYGPRVGSVHVKDRVRGGGTVPLGEGDADFGAVFAALGELAYAGEFILQVARGESGDEVAWAKRNRAFLDRYLESAH